MRTSARNVVSIESWNSRPRMPIGIVAQMRYQPIRASSCDRSSGLRRLWNHARPDADEVAAEVDELRQHRPELHDGGEPGARIVPPEEGGDDAQVRRAGDRQELGEPLHDPEDDRLQHVHGCGSVEAERCSLASRDAPSWPARDGLRTARRGRRAFATLDARAARSPALGVAHDGPGRARDGDRLDARPRGHRAPAAVLRPDRRDRHPRRDPRAAHAARRGGRGRA